MWTIHQGEVTIYTVDNAWIDRHAAFVQTDLYKNYYDCLLSEREKILMEGKKTRDPHILSKLDGFDQAASFFQRCVDTVRAKNTQEIEHEAEPCY